MVAKTVNRHKEIRILAGALKGTKITHTLNPKTRPTSHRLRTVIFDILMHRYARGLWGKSSLEGQKVLDLYAGTGALGFESLSRGADHVTMIEACKQACLDIQTTKERLGLQGGKKVHLLCQEVMKATGLPEEQYSLIFMDPPYEQDNMEEVLRHIVQQKWGGSNTLLVLERHRDSAVHFEGLPWKVDLCREQGIKKIAFLLYCE